MPPPGAAAGIAGWCRDRLFSSPLNIVLTVLVAWLLFMTLPALIDWLFLQADFSATSAAQCRAAQGACWAFIAAKHRLILFGLYPYDEQWRPLRSEEHTSELQSLMRISYAVFCLKKKKHDTPTTHN